MPFMRSEDEKVIAILLSDIHLSLNPPIWRSAEPDWLEAQARPLEEMRLLQDKYDCPVICAGDIFDRNKGIADGWNAPPELINYALMYLPNNMYAIPGQHDLPNHRYEDIHRSAYWTLVESYKIKNLSPDSTKRNTNNLKIFGFPPGYEIKSCPVETKVINIAVIHDYVWIPGCSYPDAPDEKQLKKLNQNKSGEKFYGYDVVVYGDNHKGFTTFAGQTTIFNCGTLMRRKSDEIDYKPQVGLLLESGEVIPHYLDISKDKYLETMEEKEIDSELDMSEFFDELEKLGRTALDFKDAMMQFLHKGKTSNEAKQIILKAMEKGNVKHKA